MTTFHAPSSVPPRLGRSFYRRDPITVARGLLGQRLVRRTAEGEAAGLIVEVEAYLGVKDRAAHSFNGRRTARVESMYCDGGFSYVFLNYGIHHLLNVVVGEEDTPQAVLLRAVEPTHGIDLMYARRPAARRDVDLCSGPGKLGAAFAIDLRDDRVDMTTSDAIYIAQLRRRPLSPRAIAVGPRIGVDYAQEWAQAPLRFSIAGNPHVSAGGS
ncbi:MAG: DNA-3-methyladenine glycosylase [Planctomycetales bacterium]|nr:DNA-3-methyladenine glycosylase [Planctomycetales bacterium]